MKEFIVFALLVATLFFAAQSVTQVKEVVKEVPVEKQVVVEKPVVVEKQVVVEKPVIKEVIKEVEVKPSLNAYQRGWRDASAGMENYERECKDFDNCADYKNGRNAYMRHIGIGR